MNKIKIPQYIDSQKQMLLWEADEILPIMFCFSAGIMFDMLGKLLILAYFLTKLFIKYKQISLDGVIEHMFFWNGYAAINKRFKNGLIREFVE